MFRFIKWIWNPVILAFILVRYHKTALFGLIFFQFFASAGYGGNSVDEELLLLNCINNRYSKLIPALNQLDGLLTNQNGVDASEIVSYYAVYQNLNKDLFKRLKAKFPDSSGRALNSSLSITMLCSCLDGEDSKYANKKYEIVKSDFREIVTNNDFSLSRMDKIANRMTEVVKPNSIGKYVLLYFIWVKGVRLDT